MFDADSDSFLGEPKTQEQQKCDSIWTEYKTTPDIAEIRDDMCDDIIEAQRSVVLDPMAERQLSHMLGFIKQEACEKIYEIEARTEEEFNLQKGRLIQDERLKINLFYERAQKNVDVRRKRDEANLENNARLQVLKKRDDIVYEVVEVARTHLIEMTKPDNPLYCTMMQLLIEEGILLMQEPLVLITARESDHKLVHSLLNKAEALYHESTGNTCELRLDTKHTLGNETTGGVYLRDRRNRIKVDNTFLTRFNIIVSKITPQIRKALFGVNKNRRFEY